MGAWGFRFWGQHAERERLNCFGFYFILFYLLGTQNGLQQGVMIIMSSTS